MDSDISNVLLIDYINRFLLMDVDARIQLFDYKTTYEFLTVPGIDKYNMPLYSTQQGTTGGQEQAITPFPMYQGFTNVVRINGYPANFYTNRGDFNNIWANFMLDNATAATGDGTATYTINLPQFPAVPGIVDISGIVSTGSNTDPIIGGTLNTTLPATSIYPCVYFQAIDTNGRNIIVSDSGQFLSGNTSGDLYGILMNATNMPKSYAALTGNPDTSTNTINYNTGVANITFPTNIPSGNSISAKCYYFQQGIPRSVLFYDNVLTLRPPPDRAYKVEIDAYLTPAALLATSNPITYAYMSEYIARGAARKILSDTGDVEQFQFYEPLFREQEMLVWKRAQRQNTSTRVQTIYSSNPFNQNYNQYSQGV